MASNPPLFSYNYSPANPYRLPNNVPVLHQYGPNAPPTIQPPSYLMNINTKGYRPVRSNNTNMLNRPYF